MGEYLSSPKKDKDAQCMKSLFILLSCFLLSSGAIAQTIGSTKTEQYKASFETKIDISQYLDYNGPTIPIQILKCGIGDDLYESYPELKFVGGRKLGG